MHNIDYFIVYQAEAFRNKQKKNIKKHHKSETNKHYVNIFILIDRSINATDSFTNKMNKLFNR